MPVLDKLLYNMGVTFCTSANSLGGQGNILHIVGIGTSEYVAKSCFCCLYTKKYMRL